MNIDKEGLVKKMGVRNGMITKEDRFMLLFYDVDREVTQEELTYLDKWFWRTQMSYMIYSTKHGYHIIGLTPLTPDYWAFQFIELRNMFHSDFIGQTIRLSRKSGEIQKLIKINLVNGEVVPNLYNVFASRFGYDKMFWDKENPKYKLVFETYWTAKV